MTAAFYIAAAVALAATLAVVISRNAVHALLLLVVSLFAVAVMFYTVGAPLAAALEIIIYAGAIMVLFIFVIMMLNLGEEAAAQERGWLAPQMWVMPGVLSAILLAELVYVLTLPGGLDVTRIEVPASAVGAALFGPYVLAVEIAGMLLLAALVGALHLGRRAHQEEADDG
ncbi:MAG: NADH-quinone oxidoreductase subunit J [Halofilum sp. (in: g-proteobacteria)]